MNPFSDLRISPIDKGVISLQWSHCATHYCSAKKRTKFVCLNVNMSDTHLSGAVVLELHPPSPQADHQMNVALKWNDDIQVNPMNTAADSVFFSNWNFLSNIPFYMGMCKSPDQ